MLSEMGLRARPHGRSDSERRSQKGLRARPQGRSDSERRSLTTTAAAAAAASATSAASQATFGVTSLRRRHLCLPASGGATISFRGKSGQPNRCEIRDKQLVAALRWLRRGGGKKQAAATSAAGQHLTSALQTSTPLLRDERLFGPKVTAAAVRLYLSELLPDLVPKDFRTYAANLAVLEHLISGPDPTRMKPGQRTRRLAEGYRAASALLNNTPRMAKDAYVFSGLSVLYQADPTRFVSAVSGGGGGGGWNDVRKRGGRGSGEDAAAAALDSLVRLFDENRIDWRYMLRWFKETGGVANFMGPAQVLLITDAGSESIDLAGTRHIVFLDATWTPSLEDQIVGRGRRFGSHAHLPAEERVLSVWKLFLTRPAQGPGKPPPLASPERSVDAYVDALNQTKREEQRRLYARLAALERSPSRSRA